MNTNLNFLPEQYERTGILPINHNYLQQQFADHDVILKKIKQVVCQGDFTLGREVDDLEEDFAKLVGTKYAIGVGSGTDALFLSLKALGIGPGDEVVTTPYTFFATIGAIVTAGAKPVFADVKSDYNLDPDQIISKITPKTKAILPVHWAGKPCDMDPIREIAQKYNLAIVEDACHAIRATYKNKPAGSLGIIGCFSFHPLKNLNVWGDAGMISTDSEELAKKLKLFRNHGLKNRDESEIFAYNSRLDTIQAVVARHLLEKIDFITESRIQNAAYFDKALSGIDQIKLPERESFIKQVYHLYVIRAEHRAELQKFLISHGVDAKVHYPIPMHLQPAAKFLGHSKGDFPVCEAICDSVISLPVHEFMSHEDQDKVTGLIRKFYE